MVVRRLIQKQTCLFLMQSLTIFYPLKNFKTSFLERSLVFHLWYVIPFRISLCLLPIFLFDLLFSIFSPFCNQSYHWFSVPGDCNILVCCFILYINIYIYCIYIIIYIILLYITLYYNIHIYYNIYIYINYKFQVVFTWHFMTRNVFFLSKSPQGNDTCQEFHVVVYHLNYYNRLTMHEYK